MLEFTNKKLLFAVAEDWFFCSHFLPMARAAIELGLQVVVVTRVRDHRMLIESTGARVIALEEDRAARGVLRGLRSVWNLTRIFRTERPEIVHLIALKPIVLGGVAARFARVPHRIYAVTGLGVLAAGRTAASKIAVFGLRSLFEWVLDTPGAHYLFENEDDPIALGIDPNDDSLVTIVGGAGVSLVEFAPTPMPSCPPLLIAIVARMLWQKGIDLAVEATRRARGRGVFVELSLFGLPDLANPKAIPIEDLRRWNGVDGITWHGRTDNIPQVWARHHVCCMPSRGGEGLPRSILEAAACGRPIVTTDVPGCRSFVRNGVDGFVVPPDDVEGLAQAFITLAASASQLEAMGLAARDRVSEQYTDEAVADAVADLYRKLLLRDSPGQNLGSRSPG